MNTKLFLLALLCILQCALSQVMRLHGGPVMDHPISNHLIWYGPWAHTDEEVFMTEFFSDHIGTTPFWLLVRCYEDIDGDPVTDDFDVPDSYIMKINTKKYGDKLDTKDAIEVVLKAGIAEAGLAYDVNDIYTLVIHDDITTASLCDKTCGMHSYFNTSSGAIKYIAIGSGGLANRCAGCSFPNGPWGGLTNQLINSFANQVINTVVNPIPPTGWYDSNGVEPATRCAGQFVGAQPFNSNKAKNYNVVITQGENHWFLIQGVWDLGSNACAVIPKINCDIIAPPTPVVSSPVTSSSAALFTTFSIAVAVILSVLF